MADQYSDKDPGETLTYAMDFVNVLANGESISTASVAVTTFAGEDDSPSDLLSGSPSISGSQIRHVLVGGLDGVTYRVRFVATTSASRVLVGVGYLPVNAQ